MFRKKESIEQDFMSYGLEGSSSKRTNESSILAKLIQLLIVIVLLGIVLFMGIFGYRYLQNDTDKSTEGSKVPIPETMQVSPSVMPSSIVSSDPNQPKEKLYTQEEMQEIVKMLMQQMQTVDKKQHKKTASNMTQQTEAGAELTEAENPDALMAALDIAEVDEVEEIAPALPDNIDKMQIDKIKSSETPKKIDHYNKVVVQKRKNTYDDLANLSQEIGTIVENMKTKEPRQSNYTSSIKKEISIRSNEMRVIIVKSGDTLSKIAKRAYGSAMAYDRILKANPDLIKNPNNIYVGQRLRVPLFKK